jgi:ubiquinone/menaquinone biosynthesis C-methylase UbiE
MVKHVKQIEQGSLLTKVVIILGVLVLLTSLKPIRSRENFEISTTMETKTGPAVYDDLYANIYDRINYDQIKNQFEVGEIINAAPPTQRSVILDVGTGMGHHAGALSSRGHSTIGVDISPSMIAKAQRRYPNIEFVEGDVNNAILFHSNSFTHVICLGFTIYEIPNKRQFIQNVYNWLMPGGYFIVHLVDKNNYVPIPHGANPRKLQPTESNGGKTMSKLAFKDMNYKATVDTTGGDIYKIDEVLVDTNTGSIRKNEHRLMMDSQKAILNMARYSGFIMLAAIDMEKVNYYNQYMYVLQKPS